MQVSAISVFNSYSGISNFMPFSFNKADAKADTSFNALSSYNEYSKPEKIFDNICEWQKFCHARILENKLDVIA